MVLLTDEEKKQYLSFKVQYYLNKVEPVFGMYPNAEQMEKILDVSVDKYTNLRDINRVLENHISLFIDEKG